MMTLASIDHMLHEEHVGYDLLRHEHTESAAAEAAATGVSQHEVGKTIVLVGTRGLVRAVIPASARLDLHKLGQLDACGPHVRLASEDEILAAYPMFELGAVPPFGGREDDATLIDQRLALRETIVFDGGTHHESMRMRVCDLVRIAAAQIADITAAQRTAT